MFACFPPCETLCALLFSAVPTTAVALRHGRADKDSPGFRKPTNKALFWATVYMLIVTILLFGVLLAGWAIGIWGV